MTERELLSLPEFKLDEKACERALDRWNHIAKPVGSLGELEVLTVRVAGITGNSEYSPAKKAVVVSVADNGIVKHGVSKSDHNVTNILAHAMAEGKTTVCHMAQAAGAEVFAFDVGMKDTFDLPNLPVVKGMSGTNDMSEGPAMTREQAVYNIGLGMEIVAELKKAGYDIIATGEIGMANTTTTSAVSAVILGKTPEEVTGLGGGLDPEGFARKKELIGKALEINSPDPSDPIDILSKVGGLDIATMVGIFIGGCTHRIPVIVDGVISSVSAVLADMILTGARNVMIPSHLSKEPSALLLLEKLGLAPIISAGLRLGEGTGAVLMFPILDQAYKVYRDMDTFESLDIKGYS